VKEEEEDVDDALKREDDADDANAGGAGAASRPLAASDQTLGRRHRFTRPAPTPRAHADVNTGDMAISSENGRALAIRARDAAVHGGDASRSPRGVTSPRVTNCIRRPKPARAMLAVSLSEKE
jgi:hypothetical protein